MCCSNDACVFPSSFFVELASGRIFRTPRLLQSKLRPNTLVPSYLVLPTMSKKRSAKDVELFKRNKRYNTSRTLETNKMWSQTIGHDPHANIVHDLDISVQALHGGGESEEFKNLSRLVAKSRADAAGSSAYRSEGRVWRGKKPLKGTFSVPAGYNNFDAPSVKQVSDNIVIGETGADEDFSDDHTRNLLPLPLLLPIQRMKRPK